VVQQEKENIGTFSQQVSSYIMHKMKKTKGIKAEISKCFKTIISSRREEDYWSASIF